MSISVDDLDSAHEDREQGKGLEGTNKRLAYNQYIWTQFPIASYLVSTYTTNHDNIVS